jgi:hypothetical protein
MQSFMRFRPVVSEEMMSKDFRSRCPEKRNMKKKIIRNVQKQFGIFKNCRMALAAEIALNSSLEDETV